ncbi:hypothetical protein ACQVP2_22405 [Methylobacterium aquaticum]|uniref:hypothetical protein n=1 Tax=Methylobacterium aquaticum TaxID=270351 RepID=UPI003D16C9C0
MTDWDAALSLPIGPRRVNRSISLRPARPADPEREQAKGLPLRPVDVEWFAARGLLGRPACTRYGLDLLMRDLVVFDRRQRFEFARDVGGPGPGAMSVYTVPARDAAGDVVDVVAWHPRSGRIASWLGRIGVLGEDSLWRPLGCDEPLLVHRDPVGWLRADWRGVVVVHETRARRQLLDAGALLAEDVDHGEELDAMLRRVRLPRILVGQPAEAAA